MATKVPKKAVLLALAGAAGLLMVGGLIAPISHERYSTETVVDQVRAWGTLGPLAVIVLLVLQAVVAPLPSPPLLMAAGFVYGPLVGFAIGWLGLLLRASACFGLARGLGPPFAECFVRQRRRARIDRYARAQCRPTVLADP